jgi:hypothetical protein
LSGATGSTGQPCVIAITPDYDSLHRALRDRREQLNIAFTTLDRAAYLTSGHASKILSPSRLKRATFETLDFLLPALGVKLALIEDPESLERLKKFPTREAKVSARCVPWGRPGTQTVVSLRFVRRIARAGGEARARALTPAQRSATRAQGCEGEMARRRWSTSPSDPPAPRPRRHLSSFSRSMMSRRVRSKARRLSSNESRTDSAASVG